MADRLEIDLAHRFRTGVELDARLDCDFEAGTLLALFGPSGAGKTTILRTVAGLFSPDRGRVCYRGAVWFDSSEGRSVAPQDRHVGYVGQEAALFPHLTVERNIGFGLTGPSRRRIAALLDALNLADLAAQYPRQLSGGQGQRVALARALAPSPVLLLLDEPFAALDAPLRRTLRADVGRLIRAVGTRAVLVTHDRLEVMAMADEVAVMVDGRIRQVGRVADVFRRPADSAVARSLGIETVVPAQVERRFEGMLTLRVGRARLTAVADDSSEAVEVFACIRAEDVVLERNATPNTSARNQLDGRVLAIEPEGPVDRVTIDCGFELVAAITRQSRHEMALQVGSTVAAAVKATAVHVVGKV